MTNPNFYITTPIYYVNDKPHIGHAYTTLLADVFARYYRLMGRPTHFLTGTDEHGQKVQEAAAKAGMTPQQQADSTVVRFQELWKQLDITNDDFIRTTEPRHTRIVQQILQDLYNRDEIYKADFSGWYCVTCERFYTEKDLINGRCPEPGCGREVKQISESNYFFRMSKYQQWLIDYIEQNPRFIMPDFRRNETLGFLRKALNDLCISRPKTRLNWGITLPFDDAFVTYVWFDALVNYISAIGYGSDEQRFKQWWPASCHLIGKDILTTHTVYWPTMLKAMNLPMPETIFAHGWWLSGKDKMSKSAGNVVNPLDVEAKYGAESFRYFLIAEMSLGQDASFTEDAFIRRCNADLANDLGNMLSRAMKLTLTHCDGKIPMPSPDIRGACEGHPDEKLVRDRAAGLAARLTESLDTMRPDLGLAAVVQAVRDLNGYFETKQPWALAKQPDKTALHNALYVALETLRIVSGLLSPVLPVKMATLRKALGVSQTPATWQELTQWGLLEPGTALSELITLFPRIMPPKEEVPTQDSLKKKETKVTTPTAASTPATPPTPTGTTLIDYVDFQKVELKTATIVTAEKVADATKLLKLTVDVAGTIRPIIAGIAEHYAPETLSGKQVILVANLKPAVIRGNESQGMLLAASQGKTLRLLTVDGELPSGSVVK